MRLPQYFILAIMFSIGLFPQFYFSLVNEIVRNFVPVISTNNISVPVSLLKSISAIGKFSLLFIALLTLIYLIRKSLTGKHPIAAERTWGCGYPAPSVRMQYTGKSFSKSLGKLLNFIVIEKKKYKEIAADEVFPATRKHSSHYNDFFVTRIFDGIIDKLLYTLNFFQFIQNGKLQLYILYGVFFIVLIFLGTVFKLI